MKLINLFTGEEVTYSHNEPLMAFAQYHASKVGLNTKFAVDSKSIVDDIKSYVKKGKHGYHMGDYSIPFSTVVH